MKLRLAVPLLLAAAASASPQGASGNVCVIVLDDVAPGMLSSFDAAAVAAGRPSQAPAATPVIDALLAGQGISFDRAWSCPTCSPSRAAMLTGRFGLRSGIGQVVPPRATRPCPGLETDVELLPGLLRGAQPPYSSGAVGKWHVADQLQLAANPQHPLGGTTQPWFDRFAGTWFNLGAMALQPYQSSGYYVWEKNYATRIEWLGASPCPAGNPPCNVDMDVNIAPLDYPSVDTIDDAIVLARELPQPWFLWVAPHAAHTPFHPLPAGLPADTCRGVAAPGPNCVYPGLNSAQSDSRCMLAALDHQLGRLFCELDFATTTVILVADNGWGQHVVVAPYSAARSKASVYQGGIEVPFVVRSPLIPANLRGSRSGALVSLVDVFATVGAIASAPAAQNAEDSVSLLPILTGQRPSVRRFAYSEVFQPNFTPDAATGLPPTNYRCMRHDQALTQGRFKLIRKWRRGSSNSPPLLTEELYDLEQGAAGGPDWHEAWNLLAASSAPLSATAATALAELRAECDATYPTVLN